MVKRAKEMFSLKWSTTSAIVIGAKHYQVIQICLKMTLMVWLLLILRNIFFLHLSNIYNILTINRHYCVCIPLGIMHSTCERTEILIKTSLNCPTSPCCNICILKKHFKIISVSGIHVPSWTVNIEFLIASPGLCVLL